MISHYVNIAGVSLVGIAWEMLEAIMFHRLTSVRERRMCENRAGFHPRGVVLIESSLRDKFPNIGAFFLDPQFVLI